jgi:hypothetical protein
MVLFKKPSQVAKSERLYVSCHTKSQGTQTMESQVSSGTIVDERDEISMHVIRLHLSSPIVFSKHDELDDFGNVGLQEPSSSRC